MLDYIKIDEAQIRSSRNVVLPQNATHIMDSACYKWRSLKDGKYRQTFTQTIRKRQLKFLGHVMRKEGLENLVLTGKIEGSRGRGRPRETYMSSLCKWMREQLPEDEKGEAAASEVLRAT